MYKKRYCDYKHASMNTPEAARKTIKEATLVDVDIMPHDAAIWGICRYVRQSSECGGKFA